MQMKPASFVTIQTVVDLFRLNLNYQSIHMVKQLLKRQVIQVVLHAMHQKLSNMFAKNNIPATFTLNTTTGKYSNDYVSNSCYCLMVN